MHHPADRIAHTTAFATLVGEDWLERVAAHGVTTSNRNMLFKMYVYSFFFFSYLLVENNFKLLSI